VLVGGLQTGHQVLKTTDIGTLRLWLPSRADGSVSIYCTVFLSEVAVLPFKSLL
jgi:hypothetical protein